MNCRSQQPGCRTSVGVALLVGALVALGVWIGTTAVRRRHHAVPSEAEPIERADRRVAEAVGDDDLATWVTESDRMLDA